MPQHLIKRVGADPDALFTIDYVRMHLRESLVNAGNDAYILDLVKTVQEHVEDLLARSTVTRGYAVSLPAFPELLKLYMSPLVAVSAVKYYDTDNTEQTLPDTDYWVNNIVEPGSVLQRVGWPTTFNRPDAVTVEFTAGYGLPAAVPRALKQYILLGVKDLYDNRGATVASMTNRLKFAEYMLNPFLTTEV